MKTNFKRIGRQSISIVLAVMMMLSTMLVGTVTSNAANIPANTDFYLDITGATANFTDSNSIYLSVTSDSNKNYTATSSDTSNAANYVPKNDSNWYQMTRIDNTNIYKATVAVSSTVGKVSFWNKNESSYDNVWQTSCSLGATYDGTNNLFTLTGSNYHNGRNSNIYSGTWSTYSSSTDNTYYICGAEGLTGYNWGSSEAAIAANKLEYDSATSTYTKTYKNIPKGDYEFKVRDTKNSWFGKGNYTITDSGCTVSGSDNINLNLSETLDVTISISSDNTKMTVTASKEVVTYTIKTETPENGTIEVSADSLAAGETFTVTATPNEGYELNAITVTTDDGENVEATDESTHTYTMPASNVTVSATFKAKEVTKYSVTYTPPTGAGVESTSIDPTDYELLAEGTTVKVTVTVKDGYTASLAVDDVNVATSTSGNTYTFTFSMPAKAITVAPKVAKIPAESNTVYLRVNTNTYPEKFRVHIWNTDGSGSIAAWANDPYMTEVADEGNGIKVFAYTPDSGTYLKNYNSIIFRCNNGTGNYNNYTDGNFTGDITKVTLQGKIYDSTSKEWSDYTVQTKYNVNIAAYDAEKGNVSVSATSVAEGDTFTVNAAPKTGYSVDKITVTDEDGTEVEKNSDGTYTMPASDVTVTVTFKLNSHTLTFNEPDGVTSTISTQGEVQFGTEVTVTVNVKDGYEAALDLGNVEVNTTIVDNQYTFTFKMPDNDIVVTPTVSSKSVPAPVISLGAAVATGGTMKASVNELKSVIATVGLPEGADDSYVVVDESRTGYVSTVTYTGADGTSEQIDINDIIVPTNSLVSLENTTTFKFDKVGTYLITYNGALKSTVDDTKTSSANATLTVVVTYSATQQAYLDLKALVEDTDNYPESVSDAQYTSGVTEYNTARADAADAVSGDLPAYDAEDIYTALNTALVTAKNNLVAAKEFYIGGSFHAGDIDNSSDDWTAHPNNIKFTQVTSNLYKVETGLNLNNNMKKYFFVYSKSGEKYNDYSDPNATANSDFSYSSSLSNAVTLTTKSGYDKGHLLEVKNSVSIANAVIWIDTSGLASDGSGSMKIFYTSGNPSAKYALIGNNTDWSGSWSGGYDANYLIKDSTDDNPFTFSTVITVGSEGKAYFRLIDSNGTQYGINADDPKSSVEITNVHYTTRANCSTAHSFQISTPGTYRLFVDQSGATPVIWISAADYNVSAISSYTYNGTQFTAFEDGNAPEITIANTTVSVGQSVAVTAVKEYGNYQFIGWVSQNGSFADSSALSTTFTPNSDNAIAIARYAKKLTVKVSLADGSKNGTWTSVDDEYLASSNLSIKFTPENTDDIITSVIVEGKEYVTSLDDNTLNFTVGVADESDNEVLVTVTFAERPTYLLGFDYVTGSDDTMGTFNCYYSNGSLMDEGAYPYGTEVTFKAVAKEGYVFKGWYSDINGTGDCLSTDATYKFTLTQNTDVFAKFAEDSGTMISGLYLIYSDSSSNPRDFTKYLNLYYNSDNQVFAYFDSSLFDDSKEYRFMISNSTGKSTSWEYAYDNYNNSKTLSDNDHLECGSGDWWLPKAGTSTNVNALFAKFKVLDDYAGTVSSVKVNLGYYNGTDIVESSTDSSKATTYEIIPNVTGTVSPRIKVYAKDGTIRSNYQKYADMADTVISYTGDDVTKLKSTDYYNEGYAKLGSTITITTTIKEAFRSTYYVKAFSVNGYSYGIINSSAADTSTGVYTFDYTVPEDCTDKFIEITPIYYYINDTDTVTFYVEGFDETVQAKWGNTVAVQAWYTNGTDTGDYDSVKKNALGGYPGQPLVYEGGKYSMQIPKYLNNNTANKVSGITLNNYIWDSVHSGNFTSQKNDNAQTYDYDDFYKLSDTKDVDNIIFDFRYRTTTDNNPSQAGLSSSTYSANELEPLKDYYGNIVDIFGNILSEDWTTDYDSQYLTIISDGYKTNYIGKYATEWSVYDHDGKYITTINCSNLIDENKVDSSYQSAYNKLKPYADLPVKIAYEKSIFGGDDKGDRADGRWYFSKKAQKISANVQIQYRTDDDSPFVEDPFVEGSNVGTTTNTKAYFTNDDYNGKTTCEGTVDGGNFSVQAETDADAKYYFIGWYLKTNDGYSFITNKSDADFPMTNNETYVARFIPTPSGTLTLSHTLLDGSAQGRTYISAKIVNPAVDNKVIATIAETSGNLVIPARYVTYASTYSIVATLRTVPYGNDEVEDFYNSNKVHYNSSVSGTGEKTYEVSTTIKELFKDDTDDEGNVSYSLIKSNIPFYSNITSKPLEYKITYSYKTRLNGDQSYVVKDTVSGMELQEMWAANEAAGLTKEQLSKTFITKKAPFVSNFREQIKWDIENASIHEYEATVSALTNTSDLTITALTADSTWTEPTTVTYGEIPLIEKDYIYKVGTEQFPETVKYSDAEDAIEYEFSYWAIFDNRSSAQQFSNAVKNYMSQTPNEVMSERLTELSQLDGYKNLIAKSYSKEYNYVSYQNYFVVPVYADRFAKDDITEAQASIRLLEYTRNQWTNANGVKGDGSLNDGGILNDYLYTDFALSFDKDQELIKNNDNIKVGIAFEIVAKYDNVDLKTYVTDSDTDAIGSAVMKANANGKVGSYTFDNANRNIYRYEIDNSTISTKNRIEYYLQFKNTANARQNVLKVYSYIYDTDSGKIYLSDPVYMNMYDIGNLTYITSDLANIDLQPAGEL